MMTMVKKLRAVALAAALTVGAAITGTAASAADIAMTGPVSGNTASFFGFSGVTGQGSTFTQDFTFTVPFSVEAYANSLAVTLEGSGIDIDLDATLLAFDGMTGLFTQTGFDPGNETWEYVIPGTLAAGSSHVITVAGQLVRGSAGTFGASVNLSAVPEPATWGMLILGFGMVGAGMRSRRRQVVLA